MREVEAGRSVRLQQIDVGGAEALPGGERGRIVALGGDHRDPMAGAQPVDHRREHRVVGFVGDQGDLHADTGRAATARPAMRRMLSATTAGAPGIWPKLGKSLTSTTIQPRSVPMTSTP